MPGASHGGRAHQGEAGVAASGGSSYALLGGREPAADGLFRDGQDASGLVPGTLPRRDLRSLRSLRSLRRSKGRRGRGAGGGGGAPKGRKPSKASKVRTKASKPPSKPSKASKPSRARTKGPSKPSKPPSLKATFSPNERRKATRERFWWLKTKKKR